MTENKSNLLVQLNVGDLQQLIQEALKRELQTITSLLVEKPKERENELLTRKEVCELLNVSTTTLFHWNNDNTLPAKKIGNRVYYQKSQIMEKLTFRN
ncbi:helix-turn-helix domain-containing protein [uncultured Flavobacterium sp.]|uniref:helix-turn-helix transcriptional regulator n=1 Tax=uncultured Flavobacterium sp. TaxID=165435 RepID=UPI0025DC6208|nr:helix-turn-helix domain-containing protein [uncultured Flavobacterium sp.]